MSLPIALRLSARNDLVDIALWYEDQRAGLSDKLDQRINETLDAIGERPTSFPAVSKYVRRALVPQFPYAIYFQVEADHVLVLAVVHTARSSRAWRRRV